ncbi:MAG: hypothetical protein AAF493_20885 [Pseudomonadota bacterium]
MSFDRFIRNLRSRTTWIIAGAGVVLGALFSSHFIWLGVLGAFAVAAIRANSSQSQWVDRVSSYAGVIDSNRARDIQQLSEALKSVRGTPGIEQLGLQLNDQLQSAGKSYASFHELLDQKFSVNEVTHGRYAKSADQVFLAVLDDLQKGGAMMKGLGAIDVDTVRAQLRMLERKEAPDEAQARELETLRERIQIHEDGVSKVRALMSSNEEALTKLTLAGAEMAKLETEAGRSELGTDDAIKQLEVLAERLDRYSVDKT